jgi:hypothetical protein
LADSGFAGTTMSQLTLAAVVTGALAVADGAALPPPLPTGQGAPDGASDPEALGVAVADADAVADVVALADAVAEGADTVGRGLGPP